MRKENKKHKKYKTMLYMSIVSTVMCFAVLFGTAFAWMTDSLTGRVARIEAENLSVDLVGADGASVLGQTLAFAKVNGDGTLTTVSEGETLCWEPDVTYQLPALKAVNTGSMAMLFTITVESQDPGEGSINILDMIDFMITVGGEKANVTVDGNNMKTEAFTLSTDDMATEGINEADSGEILISGRLNKEAAESYKGQQIGSIIIKLDAQQIVQ